MHHWLWGIGIWLLLCILFAARWDWSRAQPAADETGCKLDNPFVHDAELKISPGGGMQRTSSSV
jgi:hypothetical protein